MGTPLGCFVARIIVFLSLLGEAAGATTRTVTNLNDSGTGSLRQAITDSSSGDIINFSVTGTISLFSQLLISGKNLTIDNAANGPNVLRVSAQIGGRFRVFQIASNTVTISGLTISNGHPGDHNDGYGGGIANGGTLTLNNCVISGNQTDTDSSFRSFGGGIYNSGTLTMTNCTVESNIANTNCTFVYGGGIYNEGTLTMNSCTVNGNGIRAPACPSLADLGDGLADVHGSATIMNCTFYENSVYNAGSITLRSCTFQKSPISNDGTAGNGITLNVGNSLVSEGNSKTPKTINNFGGGGTVTSAGYNLTNDDANGLLIASGDQINTDPRLEPNGPQYNGGYTDTIALRCGSAAIDQGKSFGTTTDQRGQLRPHDNPGIANASGGDGSDIGAYEAPNDPVQLGYPQFVVNTTADHDDGVCGSCDCTLREAINTASPGASPTPRITFASNITGTITVQSQIAINKNVEIDGPGARTLAISGGTTTRIFTIDTGTGVTIFDLTIRDGKYTTTENHGETHQGGAVFNLGNLTFARCAFINNSIFGATNVTNGGVGGTGQGGAIFNAGTLRVVSSTLFGNSATGAAGTAYSAGGTIGPGGNGGSGQGGAIFNNTNSSLTIQNCTFSGNTATGGAGGAGSGTFNKAAGGDGTGAAIFTIGGASGSAGGISITGATISGNTGTGGLGYGSRLSHGPNGGSNGGIFAGNTTLNNQIGDTILAANMAVNGNAAPDAEGPFNSAGFNLVGIGDQSTGFTATGDQVGTTAAPINPHLGPLQNNGGSTDTMALLLGSTALDRGARLFLSSDQRGSPRPVDTVFGNVTSGDGSDIGAVEMNLLGGPDSDGDTMSDDFERFFGLNPFSPTDANIDSDGDGLTNVQEFRAGTNPFDPTSAFRITQVTKNGSDFVVTFGTTIAGKTYRLERKDALTYSIWGSINGVSDFSPAASGSGMIADPNGAAMSKRFYRVRVLP